MFLVVLAHALCGTKRALVGALGNAPFASLIVFCLVVPVLTYAALPLTLSVASVHAWTHARAARPGEIRRDRRGNERNVAFP